MVASLVNSFSPQVSGGTGVQHWSESVAGGTLHTYVGIGSSGVPVWVSTALVPSGISAQQSAGTLTTVGAGTLTAALLLGGLVLRSGPTAAFTDTTDTAALIQAAWTGGGQGSSFVCTYQNASAFAGTIAGGTGVTLSGNVVVPPNSWAKFLFIWTGASTITAYWLEGGSLVGGLPAAQYTTSSVTTGSIAAGVITGAGESFWLQTGATPGAQLVRTAAQLLADTPNGHIGQVQRFRILNTGAGTLTLTTDAGTTVTISGTATVAQNTWRDFMLTFNTATTATVQSVGAGVAP